MVNRPRNSGTRAVFTKTIMGGMAINESGPHRGRDRDASSASSSRRQAPSSTRPSAGRAEGHTEVLVDGVAPTDDNIIVGSTVWSYEHMFTYRPPASEIAKLIAFVDGNAELVRKEGLT